MMQRPNLGEFEELILLVVASLNDRAYGITVLNEIEKHRNKKANISAIHTALERLEKKTYLSSYVGGATGKRGGRSKRYFEITPPGIEALVGCRQIRNELFDRIPESLLNQSKSTR